jgi:hypothetical protein
VSDNVEKRFETDIYIYRWTVLQHRYTDSISYTKSEVENKAVGLAKCDKTQRKISLLCAAFN